MIMDAPPMHYVTPPSTMQMQYAYNENLNDIKRGVMIDRLIAEDKEPDLVNKLLKLYRETENKEVKAKIAQGLMLYNQRHRNIKNFIGKEQPILKAFFAELLDSQTLTPQMADNVVRGYIETHSSDEIMSNLEKINKTLLLVPHTSSIMLKYSLVHKSKELQKIYISSIVEELRKANNSDLDSYFFGPLSMGYQGSGKKLLDPESKQVVLEYLNEIHYKYTPEGIKAEPNDIHRHTTAPYYFELFKIMNN